MPTENKQESPVAREELYRKLPSVNELLLHEDVEPLIRRYSREVVVRAVRVVVGRLRDEIAAGKHSDETLTNAIGSLCSQLCGELEATPKYSLRKVINATGVVLHTNLGRAPLSERALAHVVDVAADYSNLEIDLESGERSRRDVHVERVLLEVLGITEEAAERLGAVVVNNCAAATFLALNALANGREVVVSRGELVEIGGGFRIPEILEKSGAVLREVGTTNRTRVADYENAVNERTALMMRVHQSNFSIEGFVERPSLDELVALSRTMGVPLFEDQGTGLISGLARFGIQDQPTLRDSLDAGVDVIAASGDKLLGGPQCGLLIGRSDLIARIRKNPLMRAFRVDKLTYAALEATLFEYLSGSIEKIPLMRMLSLPVEQIEQRCRALAEQIGSDRLRAEVVAVESVVGGGTAPNTRLASYAVALAHADMGADELLKQLRTAEPPIVGRISEDKVMLDLRTVPAHVDETIRRVLEEL